MVAPIRVRAVEDSFVRIAPKNNVLIIQADITQSLVENDNNIHSPINRQIEDLVANQIRQTRLGSNRISEVLNQFHQSSTNNQNETTSNLQDKNMTTAINVSGHSLPNRNSAVANVARQLAHERKELLLTLPPSQQRSTVVRMRSKLSLTERALARPATEDQQVQLIKKLEKDVDNLKKDQIDLMRKVSLFKELFQDPQKLDKVLKMLEENKKI